jgi:tetratricopeptide (TPR) repeat protein
MKKYFALIFLVGLAISLSAPMAIAQTTGSVKGVCKDTEGKPIAGAEVVWTGVENGHSYTIKTNNKGEYFSLGIMPGVYNVRLMKDGTELFHINGFYEEVADSTLDFDLKKEAESGVGKSADQKGAAELAAKAAKEKNTVKAINDKLNEAKAASDAGDMDKTISILTEANAIDSTRDLVWFRLGDAYAASAAKQTDSDEKKKRYGSAAEDYQKSIDLRKASEQAQKDPDNNKKLAAYYNNLAQTYSKMNKLDDAITNYNQAAQLDATGAATYYFNEGAVLTNAGRTDDAIAAFDKTIATDPTRALAYYWKGINLIGKETVGKDNKTIVPPGTAEAFQKYLELDPNGPMAQTAKDMLATIGVTVETNFGKKKQPAKN